MANMFDKAKAEAPKEATKKGGKEKLEVPTENVRELAAVKALMKTLEGVAETLESDVKESAADNFVKFGNTARKRPANFRVTEEGASASAELRKRSERSVLTKEEQELLAKYNLSTKTITDVDETFAINPKYAGDSDLLGKVAEALEGIVPEDFIQAQTGKTRTVVAESALDELFNSGINDPSVQRELLSVVGTLALKPKLDNTDPAAILKDVAKVLGVK